jgi:RHS repeat-associated protein
LAIDDLSTIYVNKYFEVREHDAPTKYVFNGDTRIARVTGSLSTYPRVQRLRVFAGWNLWSAAVTATDAFTQLSSSTPSPAVEGLYRWIPQTSGYAPVLAGETVVSGTVLWLKSATNTTLTLVGVYSEPSSIELGAGANYVPSAGLEAWYLGSSLPAEAFVWRRDIFSGGWELKPGAPLRVGEPLAEVIGPGEALFIQTQSPAQLSSPEAALCIRYYHQDHLGSSAAFADATGRIIEETTFHPFGQQRSQTQFSGGPEDYQFTQKERDRESGLNYFEARYAMPVLGRFASTDPLGDYGNKQNPQSWNCYAYALNNPLRYLDPRGLYSWDAALGGAKADKDVSEDIRTKRQAFRDALTASRDAASKVTDSNDRTLATRSVNSYGTENDGNDVKIGILDDARKQRNVGGHTRADYSSNFKKASISATFDFDKPDKLMHIVSHESSHVLENQDFAAAATKDLTKAKGDANVNLTTFDAEHRGYTVESIIAQAAGEKTVRYSSGRIWDHNWAPAEISTKRSAAIDALVEKAYGVTRASPGRRIAP